MCFLFPTEIRGITCSKRFTAAFSPSRTRKALSARSRKTPRAGLLSVGTEEGKGNALVKETFPLLKESGLHFIGNVEAKSALSGEVDVIVSDGFSGNVLLKSMEGTAKSVLKRLAAALKKHATRCSEITPRGGRICATCCICRKTA